MIKISLWLVLVFASMAAGAEPTVRPWQRITDPTAQEVAAGFADPPPEYGPTVTWGWNGPMSEDVITRDLDTLHAKGLRVATIEAGYWMENAPYLSDQWFQLIRYAAEQARARGMRLWIIDEGKYPSGFAGGRFSTQRPDLRMQGIAIAERVPVAAGETVTRQLAPEVVGVIAVDEASGDGTLLDASGPQLQFTAPPGGRWQLLIVDHQFRTGETRAVNDPTQAKTRNNSMGDLLSPAAVQQFIAWTHEAYLAQVGDLLGNAILGFRGDEPDFASTPWTPLMLDEFRRRKGYDVRPYLAWTAALPGNASTLKLSDEARRIRADYWDVWSDLFAENFFAPQTAWCARHGVEYMVHLNNDHDLAANARSSGDFFKNMRHVAVPGVDVIWSQIYPGRGPADFPKFASSAAHVYGHPRALSESFAAFRDPVTVDVARWVVNQQLVRGINLFEFMFYPSSASRNGADDSAPPPRVVRGYLGEPAFPALAAYVHRVQYLLAQGRPAASIAVYVPTTSIWLGDREANASMLSVARRLMERQRDFDFVDEAALASVMKLEGATFTNASGQHYRTVIIPAVSVISQAALERLRVFARAGGTVVALGPPPEMVVAKTFLHAPRADAASGDWAWRDPAGELSEAVLDALPAPAVTLDQPAPGLKVMHRRWQDADVYMFFNEGAEALTRTVTLHGAGGAQRWDGDSGSIVMIPALPAAGRAASAITIQLTIPGGKSDIIVIGPPVPVAS